MFRLWRRLPQNLEKSKTKKYFRGIQSKTGRRAGSTIKNSEHINSVIYNNEHRISAQQINIHIQIKIEEETERINKVYSSGELQTLWCFSRVLVN